MKILVVDDDPGLRKSLGLLLTGDGQSVAAESTAADALKRLEARPSMSCCATCGCRAWTASSSCAATGAPGARPW